VARWKGGRGGRGFSRKKKWTASSICNNLKDFLKKIYHAERRRTCVVRRTSSAPQGCIAHGV